ncbi:MAG: hypothetical protein OEY19_05185 [Gammaproteobacteria bacterium]|nr:hypothetical protein [Gammaproteobacteria bacterium]MDH5629782.1 hypothetical protein [Gammaproteobacteria bacterium]
MQIPFLPFWHPKTKSCERCGFYFEEKKEECPRCKGLDEKQIEALLTEESEIAEANSNLGWLFIFFAALIALLLLSY